MSCGKNGKHKVGVRKKETKKTPVRKKSTPVRKKPVEKIPVRKKSIPVRRKKK